MEPVPFPPYVIAMRYFNKEGPVVPVEHYHIPPLSRIDLDEVVDLIGRKRYFVLHAPRQTGKTTTLGALRNLLNDSGKYQCVYANVEPAHASGEDVKTAVQEIVATLALEEDEGRSPASGFPGDWPAIVDRFGSIAFRTILSKWAAACPKPLVVLIDEIDALVGDSLLSVLRQLRAGYRDRPERFPHSVILCGVRDYRVRASSEDGPVTGGSAFNIKAASLRLGDFSEMEVRTLLSQHSEETGQQFVEGAMEAIWKLTQGQPWLVNALAYEICSTSAGIQDRSRNVTPVLVRDAAERLILRRDTHLDQLAEKLKEPRVRRVIEPMLAGTDTIDVADDDDLRYVRDLGLARMEDPVAIANPIYQEVIPRVPVPVFWTRGRPKHCTGAGFLDKGTP